MGIRDRVYVELTARIQDIWILDLDQGQGRRRMDQVKSLIAGTQISVFSQVITAMLRNKAKGKPYRKA